MDSPVSAGFLSAPLLSRVRALGADSIMFLNNEQLAEKALTRRFVNDAVHSETLLLKKLLMDGFLQSRSESVGQSGEMCGSSKQAVHTRIVNIVAERATSHFRKPEVVRRQTYSANSLDDLFDPFFT